MKIRQLDAVLERTIEEVFGLFLRTHHFEYVGNDMPDGWGADRVAFFESPDYRLIFECDQTNTISVGVVPRNNRSRGGALGFLLQFLSGKQEQGFLSLDSQCEGLARYHSKIGDLMTGRDDETYKTFLVWVDQNWGELKRRKL